jgi:hypothetical protein
MRASLLHSMLHADFLSSVSFVNVVTLYKVCHVSPQLVRIDGYANFVFLLIITSEVLQGGANIKRVNSSLVRR